MDDPDSREYFTRILPGSTILISLAILFVTAQLVPSIFPSLDNWPFVSVPIYAFLGWGAHLGVAAAFLRSDPRVWHRQSGWFKKNISVLDPKLQETARAAAWNMVAPRLSFDTAIVSGVGAAGGAYELGSGTASIIGIAAFLAIAWILKRTWLDSERHRLTEILDAAAREL